MDSKENIRSFIAVMYTPHLWGEVDRFQRFYSSTYRFGARITACVSGVASHFHKSTRLISLAKRLIPGLEEDRIELDAKGITRGNRSAELTAVVEAAFFELYASIECMSQVIRGIYGHLPGIPNKSSRKLFKNAKQGKIDKRVPEQIVNALVKADDWVSKLRTLRDAALHTEIGSCHQDNKTKEVFYLIQLNTKQKQLEVINNVFSLLDSFTRQLNLLLGLIFKYLNSTLSNNEVQQICGIFGGRGYTRFVRPSEVMDFNDGRCDAYRWFEKENNPKCPFMDECGAYLSRGFDV